jgi:3D (Asp-Asp-Asp) domain-containing protein
MGRVILSIFLLVVLTSFSDVKTSNVSIEANTHTYKDSSIFTVQLIEGIKKRNVKIHNAIKRGFLKERLDLKVKSEVKILRFEDEKGFEIYVLTAYTNGYESTQKRKGEKGYGITASGVKTKAMHTAACPKSMPFGTELFVPYFDTTFVCEDRGGAIKAGKLDIYMETVEEALEFGRKKLVVKVIKKNES